MNPHREGKLLAGDGVHHRLKDAREARRLHAAKPPGERPEPYVVLGKPVETPQVSLDPERPFQDKANRCDVVPAQRGAGASQLHG